MVASKLESPSELVKGVESKPAYRFTQPNRGIVPISREGVKAMSGAFEAAPAAVVVDQGNSSPETRVPTDSVTESGDARRGETPCTASADAKPADFRPPEKDRAAYLIKWGKFEEQLSNAFAELFCSEHFADVTLACDGGDILKAHKIILAMSSPFFRRIFIDTPCKHPIVVLKEFSAEVMRNILQYLYMGKVVLHENEISSFMDAADFFGICGVIPDNYSCDIFATTLPEPQQRRISDKESRSETDVKLSENSRTSENEEFTEAGGDAHSSAQEDERTILSHSPVIKYHGIKARWTRRYSNNSFPEIPSSTSANVKENKRSASVGEVESVQRSQEDPLPEVGSTISKIPKLQQESLSEPVSNLEMPSIVEGDKISDRPNSVEVIGERQRRIIQTTYPTKDFRNAVPSHEDSVDEWKNQGHLQNACMPLDVARTHRHNPYNLGAKDFSHPLQVSVDTPKHIPSYGSSSSSTGVLDPAKSKAHSGFTMYTSPQSLHSQMRSMLRQDPETEFSLNAHPMSLASSNQHRISDERSPLKYRQLSSGSSTATSPTAFRQQEYPHRSHYSLLSTQNWPFSEGHTRLRHHMEEPPRDSIERRYHSDSLDRGISSYSNASHLRGMANKAQSYPTATDLSVSVSVPQQYALGYMPQLRSPPTSSTAASATRPKTKAIRSSQVPQSSRYTAAEVDQMVDAVANYPGNIVPCTLCQKFVKRERLRAHIHECHLLTGEKIICPHCGIALKSKGSFRVHIWRHKRGALPTRSTMSDFDGRRPPSPSHNSGPASH